MRIGWLSLSSGEKSSKGEAISDSAGHCSFSHNQVQMEGKIESVQVFGRKKNATAVAYCKRGNGLIKINGTPIELVEPEILRVKTYEPVLLLGQQRFANVR